MPAPPHVPYMAAVLHTSPLNRTSALLLYVAVFYFRLSTQKASDAGMEDALLKAIARLTELLDQISNDVDFAHADEEAIACLDYVARASYDRPSSVVCFPAVKAMLLGAKRALKAKGYEQPSIETGMPNCGAAPGDGRGGPEI